LSLLAPGADTELDVGLWIYGWFDVTLPYSDATIRDRLPRFARRLLYRIKPPTNQVYRVRTKPIGPYGGKG